MGIGICARWTSHRGIHVVHAVAVRLLLWRGSKRRVDGVEVLWCVCSDCRRLSRRVTGGRGRSVALRHGTLAVGRRVGSRCGRWRRRVRCWRGIGRRLYLRWAGLLLEDGIVAKTLAFALLAVSARGVGFIALGEGDVSTAVEI
jgi:hypothetical protein